MKLIELYSQYAFWSLAVLLAIFLALILTYCIGRMFGAGFFLSKRTIDKPTSPSDTTAKEKQSNETKKDS